MKAEWGYEQKKKTPAERIRFDSERALAALPKIEPDAVYVIGWHFAPSTSVDASEMFHEISFADAAFMKVGLYLTQTRYFSSRICWLYRICV